MDIKALKSGADLSLSVAGYNPKKLALIHTGAALLFSLVLTVLQFVLNRGIASTGGLSGIGLRTILSTAQMVLSTAALFLLPFWEIGFSRASLLMASGGTATPTTLLEGFRRIMPIMRLFLLQFALYMGLTLISSNIASMVFMLTPFSAGLNEAIAPLATDPEMLEQALVSNEFMMQLLPHLIPMYVILAIILAVLAIPLFYRFRMAQFAIMDEPQIGALAAMKISAVAMRNNRMNLFRLDLHFWWFYAAQILIALIGWLDQLLPMAGIALPINPDVSFFLFYALHIALSLLLAWQYTARVQTTYAHFYLSNKPIA